MRAIGELLVGVYREVFVLWSCCIKERKAMLSKVSRRCIIVIMEEKLNCEVSIFSENQCSHA